MRPTFIDSFPRLPLVVGEEADALSRIAAFLDRELTRIDHSGLYGFCPCAFAAEPVTCLRLGPTIDYAADIAKEDRPRPRERRAAARGRHGGAHDDGGGGDDGGGPPPPQRLDARLAVESGRRS